MTQHRSVRSRKPVRSWAIHLGSAFSVILLTLTLVAFPVTAQGDTEGGSGTGDSSLTGGSTSIDQPTGNTTGASAVGLAEEPASTTSDTPPQETPSPTPTTTPLDSGDLGSGAETGESDEATTDVPDEGTETPTAIETATAADAVGSPVAPADDVATTDEEAITHQVLVTVFDCGTDPGANPPQIHADCAPVEGAGVNVSVAQVVVGTQSTNDVGQAVFDVEEGSAAQVSQEPSTITSGYMAKNGGIVDVNVSGPVEAQLVNVLNSTMGRFQVASGQCFTLGEPHTEFMVVGPMARAASQTCGPLASAEFTVTGGALTEPMVIVTNGSGSWTGYLDPGEYAIARAGESVSFSVIGGNITAVVAIDYVIGPSGTLTVERYVCSDGEPNGVTVTAYPGGGGGPPNESCVPSNVNVEVYSTDGGATPLVLDLQGGSSTRDLAAGQYVVVDYSGIPLEPPLDLAEGSFVQVVIVEIRVMGSISGQLLVCNDPASNFEDPTAPGYWSEACSPAAAGSSVSLLDEGGELVAWTQTGSGGSVHFDNILPATYVLTAEDQCAIFADGADARHGFRVLPRGTVQIAAYECAKPSLPPINNGTGGGGNGGGSNGGGQSTDNSGVDTGGALASIPVELFSIGQFQPTQLPVPKPKLYVHTLPAIGVGETADSDSNQLMFASLLMGALVAGYVIRRRLGDSPGLLRNP